jgi:hypothetical protein
MANSNFIVQHGLQVGNLVISATTGDITTTGNVTVTGGGSINVDAIGVSSIAKNDSSLSINDTGSGSAIVVALDGVTRSTTSADGINLPSGESYAVNGVSVLNATTLGATVTSSSLTSVGTLGSLSVTGTVTAGGFSGPVTGNITGNITGNVTGNITGDVTGNVTGSAATVTSASQPAITSVGTLTGLTLAGNILPASTLTYNLGSPTMQWHSMYVGPGSLYVNGQKVLQDESGTIVMSADMDQNISVQTKGAGDIILDPTGTGTISLRGPVQVQAGSFMSSSDGNPIQFGNQIAVDALTSKSANTDLTITANGTGVVRVSDDMTITGNLNVTGTTTNLSVTNLAINDNIVDIASATTGTPTQNAGIRVVRGDSPATQVRWNESGAKWEFTNDGAAYNPMLVAGSLAASLVPTDTLTYDLGSATNKWRSIYAGSGTVYVGNLSIGGDSISSSNSTITIDPASAGVGGTVVIAGNLQVTGTTTTINSATVTTTELNIEVAKDAVNAAAANGGGLTVNAAGANATLTYTSADDRWNMNKNLNVGTVYGALSGNASTATTLATARNINGVSFNGSADITVTAAAGTLTGATLNSTVTASSLTSVGTLGSLAVTGAITGASFNSITGLSAVAGAALGVANAGTATTAARADHVHAAPTTVSGNAGTATTLQTARLINGVSFNGSADITVTAAAGTLTGATLASGVTASSLTSVGTITSGTWSGSFGAVSGANLTNITGANVTGTVTNATNATHVTGTSGTLGYSTASVGVGVNGIGGPQVMGSTTNAAQLSFHRAGAYAVNMGLDTDNVFRIGGWSDGTNTYRFQVSAAGAITASSFSGVSTTAKYADLAENYQADASYAAGTVVMFGGAEEVTIADADTKKVAGVVSTNPAHLMNGGLTGARVVALALQGRVPCKVIGPVAKGDLMVSAGFGYAKADNNAAAGTIIGKALQSYGSGKGMIEVVVGRV